ncbi:MAG: HNH endonuclease [Bacteroidales bacterium]|nr:HNH endonuclease [Bacteroidales bacterium]
MKTTEELRKEYEELLQRPEWQSRRGQIMKRDLMRCRICGSPVLLQVHHRQYHRVGGNGEFRKPWDYQDRYLITLCESCHKRGHQQYRIPVFNL